MKIQNLRKATFPNVSEIIFNLDFTKSVHLYDKDITGGKKDAVPSLSFIILQIT